MRLAKIRKNIEAFALRGNVVDFVMAVVIGGGISKTLAVVVHPMQILRESP